MSPPRKLTDEDRRVWRKVARTVKAKDSKTKDVKAEGASPKTRRTTADPVPAPRASDFAEMMRVPPRTAPTRPTLGPLEATHAKSVRRGRVEIDARVDLHDLRLHEAYPALSRALIRAYNSNKRCVLVITGKGPRLEGKIRTALPGWLAGQELRPIVATYSQAHVRHGGTGAWYVFLKQRGDG